MELFGNAIMYALCITSGDYGKLRSAGFSGFDDIASITEDRAQMLAGLPKLEFKAENICDMQNPTRAELHEKIESYKDTFKVNVANNQRSFLMVYYGGHGCSGLGRYQNVILNESSPAAAYPLEERLRNLATMNGATAVCGIYDCSRVPATPGLTLGDTIDLEREEYEKLSGSYGSDAINYVAFRACQP